MAYSPSIGDVALVCQVAYNIGKKFRSGPSDVCEIFGDCREVGNVLRQLDELQKDRWAPMNRDDQSRHAMKQSVAKCHETLKLLDAELARFPSFLTAKPSLSERTEYLITNFKPLRERLSKDRDHINVQLGLGTNDVVGRIYEAIRQLAADMKAGRKEKTIVGSGRGDTDDVDDDTWTVITRELEYENISPQELESHRAEIEPLVQQMRRDGEFEENPPLPSNDSELSPWDSVTEVGSSHSGISTSQRGRKSELSKDSLSTFRSVPIWDISSRTIFNPSVNSRGIRIPDTFDVWELARLSWKLQRTCTNGLPGLDNYQQEALQSMVATLGKFDPALLLCLAESSTDKNFWNHFSEYPEYQIDEADNFSGYGPQTILYMGTKMLKTFESIDSEVTRYVAHSALSSGTTTPNPAESTMIQSVSKRSRLSLPSALRRSKSTSRFTKRDILDGNFFPKSKFEFLHISGFEFMSMNGPQEWAKKTSIEVARLSCLFESDNEPAGLGLTRQSFQQSLKRINSSWQIKYTAMQPAQRSEVGDPSSRETRSLLIQWLLSALFLDGVEGYDLEDLSNDLAFKSDDTSRRSREIQQKPTPPSPYEDELGRFPRGWERRETIYGRTYYYKRPEKHSSWKRPSPLPTVLLPTARIGQPRFQPSPQNLTPPASSAQQYMYANSTPLPQNQETGQRLPLTAKLSGELRNVTLPSSSSSSPSASTTVVPETPSQIEGGSGGEDYHEATISSNPVKVKEVNQDIPILVVDSLDEDEDSEEFFSAGED